MRKTFKRTWSAGGVTLVELMVAMVVLTIAALSALGQYQSRQTRTGSESPNHCYLRYSD